MTEGERRAAGAWRERGRGGRERSDPGESDRAARTFVRGEIRNPITSLKETSGRRSSTNLWLLLSFWVERAIKTRQKVRKSGSYSKDEAALLPGLFTKAQ